MTGVGGSGIHTCMEHLSFDLEEVTIHNDVQHHPKRTNKQAQAPVLLSGGIATTQRNGTARGAYTCIRYVCKQQQETVAAVAPNQNVPGNVEYRYGATKRGHDSAVHHVMGKAGAR